MLTGKSLVQDGSAGPLKVPELLAPAGSKESLVAAINAGADAVYLGGSRFGARNYAENFDQSALRDAVQYAHIRGVRVYVTVNTLVRGSELPDTARFILFLYGAGVDAILVQDIGVASLAREIAPGLPLHASTQMTVYNREGVAWAREQGFSRVVLARELTLGEISEIASAPECHGVGLEIFVHGALCYSYSGQCLLSSMIGGRSGNRGMCAQPCRKSYSWVSGPKDTYARPLSLSKTQWKEQYLLSTKDLCGYRDLTSIIKAPVESLKIEGRMRSPRYVSTVVSVYRTAIDAIAGGKWEPLKVEEEELALAFNRDFTRGYLMDARHNEIMSRDHPDHRGILVGTVTAYNPGKRTARVRLSGVTIPDKGDGVVFIDSSGTRERGMILQGSPVRDGDGLQVPVLHPVWTGDLLYLTRRNRREIPPGISGQTGNRGKNASIPLDLVITWDNENRPVLSGMMPGKNGVPVHYNYTGQPMQPAVNTPLGEDQICRQIGKSGGTQFKIRNLVLHYPGGLFTPVSTLNQLRRDFLKGAESAIASSWAPGKAEMLKAEEKTESLIWALNNRSFPAATLKSGLMNISVYAGSAECAMAALETGCDRVYYEPETRLKSGRCRNLKNDFLTDELFSEISGKLKELLDHAQGLPGKPFWKWPSIPDREFIDRSMQLLPQLVNSGLGGIMIDSAGLEMVVREKLPGVVVCGGAALNLFNHLAVTSLPGFSSLTLSPELSFDDIKDISSRIYPAGPPGFEVIAQGNIEVLNSRDCIPAGMPEGKSRCNSMDDKTFFGLQDATGRVFPVSLDPWCHTIIRNSSELCLIDSMPALIEAGISSVAIDARHRSPAYVQEMVSLYREAIRRSGSPGTRNQFTDLLGSVKKISLGGITSASFRGNLL